MHAKTKNETFGALFFTEIHARVNNLRTKVLPYFMGESTLMRDLQFVIAIHSTYKSTTGCCFWQVSNFFVFFSYLYQIAHLGDEDDEPEFSSAMPLEEGDTFFFAPRPLRNLVLVDELDSLSPILGNY